MYTIHYTSVGIFSDYLEIAKSTKRDIFFFRENVLVCFDREYGSASKIVMNNNYTNIPFMFSSGIFSPAFLPMKNFIDHSAKKECYIVIKATQGYIVPENYLSIVLSNEVEESPSGYLVDKESHIVPYVPVEIIIPNAFKTSVNSLYEIESIFKKTENHKTTVMGFESREDFKEMYNSKVTDGTFRFNIDNKYMMILYKSFIPNKSNDKIDLEILPFGDNKFCAHFVIKRKISKAYKDMHIYSFMMNVI